MKLVRSRHPWRTAGWALAASLFVGSLLAAKDLTGVAALAALVWVAAHAAFLSDAPATERYGWVLLGGGLLCLAIPELVYVRDSFDGGELYRMNTVFKLGYQAWLLLAIVGAGVLVWSGAWLSRRVRLVWAAPLLALLVLAGIYPVAGTYARKGGFSDAPHLDGLRWLERSAPGDPPAIDWLNDHAPHGSVVLEAVGDDYSAFGHARISTFTGLPTVMGWAGHELQWGARPRPPPRGRRDDLRGHDRRGRPAAARALRRPLRRRRPARAHQLRRRRRRQMGRARPARVRPRRHDDLGAAVMVVGDRGSSRCPARVEPLGQAAGRVPRLALGEPAPPPGDGLLAVLAHPPDPEGELAALVARRAAAPAARGCPR